MNKVDVVIVAYGNRQSIGGLVQVVRSFDDIGVVVVVDNGTDGSAEAARSAGAVAIDRPDNPGFGSGQNAGVSSTTAPLVLLLNPDAWPDPEGLKAGVRHLEAHPDVAAVQGDIVNTHTGSSERSHGRELGPLHLLGRALGLRRLLRFRSVRWLARHTSLSDHVQRTAVQHDAVQTLAATAMLIRRAAFDAVGGFDESYFLYGEDLDLCRRLRGNGFQLVALPERFATHESGASSEGWWARELEWWRGTMRFAARWWSSPAWAVAVVAALLRWLGMTARRPSGWRRAWRGVVADGLRERRVR